MNDTITLPNVGDKVRAKYIPSVTGRDGRQWTNDYVFTVSRVDPNYPWFQDGESKNGPVVWGDFIDPDTGAAWHYYVTQWETIVDTDIVEPPLSEQEQRIKDLEAQNEALRQTIRRIESEAVSAIASIGQTLIDESNDRDWCEEFDRLIEQKNSVLPDWLQLPTRSRDWIVTWTDYVSISIPRSTTVTAATADEAISMAQNNDDGFDLDDLRQAYYNGDCETTDTADWEAEED